MCIGSIKIICLLKNISILSTEPFAVGPKNWPAHLSCPTCSPSWTQVNIQRHHFLLFFFFCSLILPLFLPEISSLIVRCEELFEVFAQTWFLPILHLNQIPFPFIFPSCHPLMHFCALPKFLWGHFLHIYLRKCAFFWELATHIKLMIDQCILPNRFPFMDT